MKHYYHIHDDWGLIRTCLPMVQPDDEITYPSLDEDCRSNDLTLEEAQVYCANPVQWAIDNDLTETDSGVHDYRKDIKSMSVNKRIVLPLADFWNYYYVLPDYRILATDYAIPDELIRGTDSDEPQHIDSFKDGEVRYEMIDQSEAEWYQNNPIEFVFQRELATFRSGCIEECTREEIIEASKIIKEDTQQ